MDTNSWIADLSNNFAKGESRNVAANEASKPNSEQHYPITSSSPTGSYMNQFMTTKDLPFTIQEALSSEYSEAGFKRS